MDRRPEGFPGGNCTHQTIDAAAAKMVSRWLMEMLIIHHIGLERPSAKRNLLRVPWYAQELEAISKRK
jgi:hypothetical protein